jgi:type VI secretion system secreted protein Hcp
MKTRKRARALGLLALFVVGATLDSRGAVDAFLRFTEPAGSAIAPKGDSTDAQFPGKDGWFEISSFDHGILNAVTLGSATGGAGVGKATLQPFTFTKKTDAASPALFKTSATGGHYKQAELALRQASFDGKSKPFYTAEFRTIYVTSMDWNGPGDDGPQESVATSFVAIEWSFTRMNPDGSASTAVTVNWNQLTSEGGMGPLLPPTLSYPPSQSVLVGGSLNVSPLTGPSDSDGIASIAILSKGAYTGGISVDSVSGAVQFTGAAPIGGPYTIVVKATDTLGLSKEASFTLLVNSGAPSLLANPDTASRVLGRSIKIPAGTLTANDSAGAIFDGLPSEVTTLGGRVSLSGSTIIYDPPTPDPGSDDTFTYRIRDSFAQTQTGTVTIGVANPSGSSGNLIIRVATGETTLQLAGIPARKYQLQKAFDVNGPWNDLGDVVTADANGSASWTDPDPTSPRFYRTYNVP